MGLILINLLQENVRLQEGVLILVKRYRHDNLISTRFVRLANLKKIYINKKKLQME
jgi:hypothetical protein